MKLDSRAIRIQENISKSNEIYSTKMQKTYTLNEFKNTGYRSKIIFIHNNWLCKIYLYKRHDEQR